MSHTAFKRWVAARWVAAVCILAFGFVTNSHAQTVTTPPIMAMACAFNTSPPAGTNGTFQLVQCGPTGGFVVAPVRGNPTDASGTIASTGVYQSVLTASSTRNTCLIQNNGSNNMSIRVNSSTVFIIVPGQTFSCINSGTVVTSLIEITGIAADTFAANYF